MPLSDDKADALADKFGRFAATLARAQFARMVALIRAGGDSRSAIGTVQLEFTGAFADQLAAAFSELLKRSVGVAEVRAMPVGDISLSRRLYVHNAQTGAEVLAIIRDHAKGVHQARDLAMALYDGYMPENASERPLEGRSRADLPRPLRNLTQAPQARRELQAVIDKARLYVRDIKTPALRAGYTELVDAWEKGAAPAALDRRLDVAMREKNRYFANRIAQTELARAHQAEVARDLMADEEVTVVQVLMNPTHPVADVCDLHARADLWGLGPGCYPKAQAPQPIYHPHCWCKIRARRSLSAADARFVPGGEAAYLRGLDNLSQAGRVMGSRARAEAVLNGASVDRVINAGKDPQYRLRRLGDAGTGHVLVRAESAPVNEAYETAKQPGGKHHGWYLQQQKISIEELSGGIDSFARQIAKHEGWIKDPLTKTADFYRFDPRRQTALVVGWRQDIQRHHDCIEILRGVIKEKST